VTQQAENASSILVARSKEIRLKPNDYKGFSLTNSHHRWPPLSRITCPYMPVVCPWYARGMPEARTLLPPDPAVERARLPGFSHRGSPYFL